MPDDRTAMLAELAQIKAKQREFLAHENTEEIDRAFDRQFSEITWLIGQVERLDRENERLCSALRRANADRETLDTEIERLDRENERLREVLMPLCIPEEVCPRDPRFAGPEHASKPVCACSQKAARAELGQEECTDAR